MKDKIGLKWCRPISNIEAKQKIARKVASYAKNGDLIGAGSGSTSFLTLQALADRVIEDKIQITIIPSSIEIQLACEALNLSYSINIPQRIDWCFDGADEVDPLNRLIKGRGGALYKEKLIFKSSNRRYIVADDSKSVSRLGENFPVPVEVDIPCINKAYSELINIQNVNEVDLRLAVNKDGPVITENLKVIFDVKMKMISEEDENYILNIPGVNATGIFSNFEFIRVS